MLRKMKEREIKIWFSPVLHCDWINLWRLALACNVMLDLDKPCHYLNFFEWGECLSLFILHMLVCQHDFCHPAERWLSYNIAVHLLGCVTQMKLQQTLNCFFAGLGCLSQSDVGREIVVSCVQQMALESKWSTVRFLMLPVIWLFPQYFSVISNTITTWLSADRISLLRPLYNM